jgi:acyl-CoA thioesterase FadM
MGDAVLHFRNEARAGDRLRMEVAAGEPTRTGFRVFYRVSRPDDNSLIALAETGMICFDYETRRMMPLPDAVLAICTAVPAGAPGHDGPAGSGRG